MKALNVCYLIINQGKIIYVILGQKCWFKKLLLPYLPQPFLVRVEAAA